MSMAPPAHHVAGSPGADVVPIAWGHFTGVWHADYAQPAVMDWLQAWLPRAVSAPRDPGRRNQIQVVGTGDTGAERLLVKRFGRQPAWKDWMDRWYGSKAQRSWQAGHHLHRHGVGTPLPIGYVDHWVAGRLVNSFYFTRYEDQLSSLRAQLIRIYRQEPDCALLMALLEVVADAIRGLHASGFIHRDLGNQNILLRRQGNQWIDLQFIDLNRGRVHSHLSCRQRAFDISRLTLPSDFLRVFKAMYWDGAAVPATFERWEGYYRARFAWHTATRRWRHPLRQRTAITETDDTYPAPRDIWIWDDKSAQAMVVWQTRDRHRLYSRRNSLYVAGTTGLAAGPVFRRYRQLRPLVYTHPVAFANRIGVSLEPTRERWPLERQYLQRLGSIPVMVRFYHHQSQEDWAHTIECVQTLASCGHAVAISLVQDRRAVTRPPLWDRFVNYILDEVGQTVDWLEVGHAINRVKWGVWNLDEYARLLAPVAARRDTLSARVMGPAVIDFEYHYLLAALKKCAPYGRIFDSLSHHLYVDRRGAPEHTQAGWSTLDKCVLARAIAEYAPACAPRLIISEVNWPLAGTGIYSPVGSPYVTPGQRSDGPGVTEEAYAAFMLRYLLITVASGWVERVYWWRLAAHGYGLIDDLAHSDWRERSAYTVLQTFLHQCGLARFICRLAVGPSVQAYLFQQPNGDQVVVAYAHPAPVTYRPSFTFSRLHDAQGREQKVADSLRLTGHPIYFSGCHLTDP